MSIAGIIVAGALAQWIAWRTRLPSILFLLLIGFVAGYWIDPDELFGESLMPIVSYSVAIILFEGGLDLRLQEFRSAGRFITALVTLGILISWAGITLAAKAFLGFDWGPSLILGAILVVTGPTVIGPMLRSIRPKGQAAFVLKWEGILNDVVGAVLAVLVFEAVTLGSVEQAGGYIALGVFMTLGAGALLGAIGALVLIRLLLRRWIPDHLDVPATVGFVIGVFALSNHIKHESGLLAVTLMGVIMANQRSVDTRHIVEFKEQLRDLLLPMLFIILAARLDISQFTPLGFGAVFFAAALILVIRPLAVFASSWKSNLTRQEKIFIGFLAPRGIVAAAVASVFALQMEEDGLSQATVFAPAVFLIITVTVTFYGFFSPFLARRLELAGFTRHGVIIIGADSLGQTIAQALQGQGFDTLLIDTNRYRVRTARMSGLRAQYGNALSESLIEELDLTNVGKLLALTPNDYVNSLACLHFGEVFGRDDVYQLAQERGESDGPEPEGQSKYLRGRTIASDEATHTKLLQLIRSGAAVKTTALSDEFTYKDYIAKQNGQAIPLFRIAESGKLFVNSTDETFEPKPGDRIVSVAPAG